jgi:hypothetical protein
MELHAIRGDRRDHVLTTHRGENDETPLHMISTARLGYYLALEQAAKAHAAKVGELLRLEPNPQG